MQHSYTFYRFYCDYVSDMFLPSHKVEDPFLCLGGMLVRVDQCNLYMHLLYNSLSLGNQMSILRHANVVNLSFEIQYGVHNILSCQLDLHL